MLDLSAPVSRTRSPQRSEDLSDSDSPARKAAIAKPKSLALPASPTSIEHPRLVGLSQPFFATTPTSEVQKVDLKAMEAKATNNGGKIRVLVAEDNKVNQEIVLRMLKLEDIYGESGAVLWARPID